MVLTRATPCASCCRARWPILLVCPASVLSNWHRELTQWGAFKSAKLHGSARDSGGALSGAKNGSIEIILTTFDTYRCLWL